MKGLKDEPEKIKYKRNQSNMTVGDEFGANYRNTNSTTLRWKVQCEK
jgi:hypothetical protein